jgi:hypothetical protein
MCKALGHSTTYLRRNPCYLGVTPSVYSSTRIELPIQQEADQRSWQPLGAPTILTGEWWGA